MKKPSLFEPRKEIPRRVYWLAAAVPFAIALLAWSILTYSGYVQPLFLPTPTNVFKAIFQLTKSGELFTHIWVSVYRVMLGFLLAAIFAVPLGILMGSFKIVQAVIEPINDFIRYLPVVAFIPLAILWTGTGDPEKVLIIFVGTFFQLVLMTMENARAVPNEYLEVAYTLGGMRWAAIWRVLVPAALPNIFDSLRVASGWAWSYLVVAEIVSANRGLGFLIIQSQRFLKTADIIAGIIVIGLLGLLFDFTFRQLSRWFFPWAVQDRS